jgi:hypothetical protein
MKMQEMRIVAVWLVSGLSGMAALPALAQEPAPAPVAPAAPAPFAPIFGRAIGCSLQGAGPGNADTPKPLKTTGDAACDDRVRADLNRLAPWFQVYPRLYFMEDGGRGNACYSPQILGDPNDFPPERSQFGTVLYGKTLLQLELRATPPGEPNYTITAILAHELGHTLQNQRNNALPVVHKELQADFIAGWTIKYMQRTGGQDVDEATVLSTFYKRGEFQFNNPDHHGTRRERLAAFLAGYDVEDNDVNVAYQKGEVFVRTIPIENGARQEPAPPPEFFAGNLGVFYVPIPMPDGTSALRVSRPPAPDSPGGRGGLEMGDVVLLLDGMPFRNEQDVMSHTARTTIAVIDVKTGQRQDGVLELP